MFRGLLCGVVATLLSAAVSSLVIRYLAPEVVEGPDAGWRIGIATWAVALFAGAVVCANALRRRGRN